jgi:ABC-2 type transport system ATP-binding protein
MSEHMYAELKEKIRKAGTSGSGGHKNSPHPGTPLPENGSGATVSVKGITKRYAGFPALKDLSFELQEGEIFGLVGPNGAGKTTLLRILATLTPADSGDAEICGHTIREIREIRKVIGFMPDFLGVYDDMTVREYFEFFSRAYDIPAGLRPFTIDETLFTIGLKGTEDAVVEGLSRGMKQRLSLGRAILHKPRVLLLDEPASGLDPLARLELREILRGLSAKGVTILISSHVLEDLADICDRVGIMHQGCLVCARETAGLIREKGSRRMHVTAGGEREKLFATLKAIDSIDGLQWDGDSLVFHMPGAGDEDVASLLRTIIENGLPVLSFYEEKPTLEAAYLTITGTMSREGVKP